MTAGGTRSRQSAPAVRGGRFEATTWTARTQDNLTLRDVDRVLTAVERAHYDAQHHDRVVPDGVRPGFLAAVADLIDLSIGAHHTSHAAVEALRQVSVPYVYEDSIHDLSLRSHAFQRRLIDSQLVTTIHGKFETRKRLTGKATRFEVSYGLDGCLAGIPVSIRYQPPLVAAGRALSRTGLRAPDRRRTRGRAAHEQRRLLLTHDS